MISERDISQGINKNESVTEAKKRYLGGWVQVESQLPENFNPHHKGFVKDYFRAQLRVSRDQKTKASRIFKGLGKRAGYLEFEEANQSLLSAIDIAVRGITHRKYITPSFKAEDYEPNP